MGCVCLRCVGDGVETAFQWLFPISVCFSLDGRTAVHLAGHHIDGTSEADRRRGGNARQRERQARGARYDGAGGVRSMSFFFVPLLLQHVLHDRVQCV